MSTATKAKRTVAMDLSGCTRHVLLLGSMAVKVPAFWSWKLFLCGLLANMQERQFSLTAWPELCPVLWAMPGGWLLVMRRARVMTDAEFLQFDAAEFCGREGRIIPAEHKADSFGYIGDKIVAVDFGT